MKNIIMKSSILISILILLNFPNMGSYAQPNISREKLLFYYIQNYYNEGLDSITISNLTFQNTLDINKLSLDLKIYQKSIRDIFYCRKNLINNLNSDLYFRSYFDSLGVYDNMKFLIDTIYYSYIKGINFEIKPIIDSLTDITWYIDSLEASRVNLDSIDGCFIPRNINDCIKDLKQLLSTEDLEIIKNYKNSEEAGSNEHFGIGSVLRKRYKLGGGSRLSAYFNAFGIPNSELNSGIIIQCLWYELNGINAPFKEIINRYKWHWREMNKPYVNN